MIIEDNGVSIRLTQDGKVIRFNVVSQSKEASQTLRALGQVHDEISGLGMKINKYPSYNQNKKKIFIRGSHSAKDNKTVEIVSKTLDEANQIVAGIQRLLAKIVPPKPVDIKTLRFEKGSTVHVRMHFMDRAFATKLCLTDHKHYPVTTIPWNVTKPIKINVPHFDEHLSQIVDVLNKSENKSSLTETVNPHRVTPQQARDADEMFHRMFAEAREKGCEVAFWRMLTGFRGPDSDRDFLSKE